MMTYLKTTKLILLCIVTISLSSCTENEENILEPLTIESKVELLEKSEWLLKDFEDRIMYTFVTGERLTYYGENNVFQVNPIPTKNPYTIVNEKFQLDLFFGNIKLYDLKFSCNNNIAEFLENDVVVMTLYKRDSNYKACLN